MARFRFLYFITSSIFITFTLMLWTNYTRDGYVEEDKFHVSNINQELMTGHDSWLKEQEKRKDVLQKACRKILDGKKTPDPFRVVWRKMKLYSHMLVDDKHEFLFCFLPKVACSGWKRVIMVLSGTTRIDDPNNKILMNPHAKGVVRTLLSGKVKDAASKLQKYKKIFFVRHPFERLLSAFRNKFELLSLGEEKYLNMLGHKLVKNYKLYDPIHFPNFVDYILRRYRLGEFDEEDDHWARYTDLCYPCYVDYDIIGHYETLLDEIYHIFHEISPSINFKFPFEQSQMTSSLLPKYFKLLSEEQTQGLYEIYRDDFILFDYSRNLTLI